MRPRRRQLGSVLFAGALAAFVPAYAFGESPPSSSSNKALDVTDIHIPSEVGYVLDTLQPAGPAHAAASPIIVHIQEAHTNEEAQRHIISILEDLVQRHGLRLVLVEGGHGNVGLSYLRAYGPLENRRAIAEKYLKLGIVSAEEYLDITSDYPLILWGVEDGALYNRHVDAFLAAETFQQSLRPVLASVQAAADARKSRVYSPALLELETASRAYADNRMSLSDYAGLLERLANLHQVGLEDAPELVRFLDVRHMEQDLQLPQVQQEQQALVQQLNGLVSKAEMDALIAIGKRMQAGQAQPVDFYGRLRQLAEQVQVPLNAYPKLDHYIRYLTESRQLQPSTLSKDLTRVANVLHQRLASTEESRQLSALIEEVDLMRKLLEFQLSPSEYARFQQLSLKELDSRWTAVLGEAPATADQLGQLESAVPVLSKFYEAAGARDQALIDRTVAKIRDTKEPIAVLITGGFHGPQLTQRLREQGMSVITVVPKITQATDERLYHAVLKYKSGHGSFAEVQAAAQQANAQAAHTGPPGLAGGVSR